MNRDDGAGSNSPGTTVGGGGGGGGGGSGGGGGGGGGGGSGGRGSVGGGGNHDVGVASPMPSRGRDKNPWKCGKLKSGSSGGNDTVVAGRHAPAQGSLSSDTFFGGGRHCGGGGGGRGCEAGGTAAVRGDRRSGEKRRACSSGKKERVEYLGDRNVRETAGMVLFWKEPACFVQWTRAPFEVDGVRIKKKMRRKVEDGGGAGDREGGQDAPVITHAIQTDH